MISLCIPTIPRGPNGKGGLFRLHWAQRRKYFEEWHWLIKAHLPIYLIEPQTEKCKVRIHQVRRRRLDTDNLYASTKPVLDALVFWGILKDDSPGWCDLTVTQEAGLPARTLIEVER